MNDAGRGREGKMKTISDRQAEKELAAIRRQNLRKRVLDAIRTAADAEITADEALGRALDNGDDNLEARAEKLEDECRDCQCDLKRYTPPRQPDGEPEPRWETQARDKAIARATELLHEAQALLGEATGTEPED